MLCQKHENNQRKRRSLGGKTSSALLNKLVDILEVPLELFTINVHRYICEIPCCRDIDNYFKLKVKLKDLKDSLRQRFSANLDRRTKRGLPSDVEHTVTDLERKKSSQETIKSRAAKSLTFLEKENVTTKLLPQENTVHVAQRSQQQVLAGNCILPLPSPLVQHQPINVTNGINLEAAKLLVTEEECENIQVF